VRVHAKEQWPVNAGTLAMQTNRLRDRRTTEELKRLGWTVLRYWETDIRRDANRPNLNARAPGVPRFFKQHLFRLNTVGLGQ